MWNFTNCWQFGIWRQAFTAQARNTSCPSWICATICCSLTGEPPHSSPVPGRVQVRKCGRKRTLCECFVFFLSTCWKVLTLWLRVWICSGKCVSLQNTPGLQKIPTENASIPQTGFVFGKCCKIKSVLMQET